MNVFSVLRFTRFETSGFRGWLQTSRIFFPALLLAALAGCSSALTKVETWDGEPASALNAATLKAPGVIHVSRVNGRSMTNYLMDDLALDYALLPGENEVVFTYKTIWAKSGVVKNGESKVHVIESKPQIVQFEASPNSVYSFEFAKPKTRQQAEDALPEFSAAIVGSDGEALARSSNWSGIDKTQVAGSSLTLDKGSDDGKVLSNSEGVSPLNRLKAVWETASEEEKKAFLRWAFE
ncbi:DUF2057 family protein [Marinobacter sp. S6332]|uniref:DUF2057 family protein n=1 Tax=Marinobacter sp. S6332 TaxID=2926403 RepID=UPI001FF43F8F|nr:DUF2057 family protein [Marinobacter sp. S6332]MCK0165020.1 DUF2057 domain-containing protein [Marinobacter sp. S6332]